MKIFSANIHLFTKKCELALKEIIQTELKLKVNRSRFMYNKYSVPMHIVVFESINTLGYFDPHTFQIGLNRKLMFGVKFDTVKDIIRHELGHFICFLDYKNDYKPHGAEYQEVCARFGWDKLVAKASLDIDLADEKIEGDLKSEKLKRKFKALLKLSESDNPHEAELATLKANQLLIKHNINLLESVEDQFIYTNYIFEDKRKSAKLNAIYSIVQSFMVRPIIVYGNKKVFLEVCGSKENIELAEYIASFLNFEIDRLWNTIKGPNLKGTQAKNSFINGVAQGYLKKVTEIKTQFSKDDELAIVKIESNLDNMVNLVYRRLSSTTSKSNLDKSAYDAGKKAGKNLNINQAIKNKSKNLFLS